jgi:hypothetical protein
MAEAIDVYTALTAWARVPAEGVADWIREHPDWNDIRQRVEALRRDE